MRRRNFLATAALLTAEAGRAVPATAQPRRGGTMRIIIQPEPPSLALALNQAAPTQVVAGKIFQSLLTFDFDLNPLPSLAKAWQVSDDGLTYTFALQQARWHDGAPFTAADVIFTTQVLLPEVHPRARANFARVASAVAPDDHTVVYTLHEPFGPFLSCFEVSSAPMMPKHLYEGTDYRTNPANAQPVGTGPFKLKAWTRGASIELVRHDDYWQPGAPYLDGIVYLVVPDAASRSLAIESGTAHQTQFDAIEPADVARLSKLPQLSVTTKGYEFLSPILWLDFNHRVKPLDDKRVRTAMLHALDREFILKNIFFGLGRVATGPVASTTRYFEADVPRRAYDVARANALLDEAGLKPGPDGVRVRLNALVLPYGEVWTRLAEYSRQALRRVGIDLTLESTDAAGWFSRTADWDYQLTWAYLSQFSDPALGVSRTYVSSNIRRGVANTNTMGYVNADVDRLFDEAARAARPEDRQRAYSEVQRKLVADMPVAWLIEMAWPTFVNTQCHDVVTTGLGVVDSYDRVWMG